MLRTLTRHTVQSTLVPHLNAGGARQQRRTKKLPRGFNWQQSQSFMKRGLACLALALTGAFALAQSAYASPLKADEGWMYIPEVSTEVAPESDQSGLNETKSVSELI